MCRDQDHWKASCSRVHHAVGELEDAAAKPIECASSRVHHAVCELEVISRYSLIYKDILTFYRLKTRCLVLENC